MPWPSLLTLAAALALAARGGLLPQTGASRTALAIVSDAKNRAIVDVGTVSDAPKMLTSFDDDRQKLVDVLRALEVKPGARSALLQGAALGAETIRTSGAPFSALVMLSATPADASGGNADALVASVVD